MVGAMSETFIGTSVTPRCSATRIEESIATPKLGKGKRVMKWATIQ